MTDGEGAEALPDARRVADELDGRMIIEEDGEDDALFLSPSYESPPVIECCGELPVVYIDALLSQP